MKDFIIAARSDLVAALADELPATALAAGVDASTMTAIATVNDERTVTPTIVASTEWRRIRDERSLIRSPHRDRRRAIASETKQTPSADSAATATISSPGAIRNAATAANSPKPTSTRRRWRRLRSMRSPELSRAESCRIGVAALTVRGRGDARQGARLLIVGAFAKGWLIG